MHLLRAARASPSFKRLLTDKHAGCTLESMFVSAALPPPPREEHTSEDSTCILSEEKLYFLACWLNEYGGRRMATVSQLS